MGRLLRILDRVDSFLSWLERLAQLQWVRWGVSFMTFWLYHLWAVFEQKPLIDRVAIALVVAAAATIIFTFSPSIFRRMISPWLKPRFIRKGWAEIENLTNLELQQRTHETIRQIYAVYTQYKNNEELCPAPEYPRYSSPALKERLNRQHVREITQRSVRFMHNYKKHFHEDVILLRDELEQRLPKTEKEAHQLHIQELHENPMNPSSIEKVVLNLAHLAKSLPPAA